MPKYSAQNITVLEGLEPVRKRPGMYIGGVGNAGLHHLVWELVDNAVDEAMNGHASEVRVTLHKDGNSVTVSDNGRGIPVDKHPKHKRPAIELIFSTLHAGGKFDGANYKTAGGLHGVGASVVNALASELTATVKRDGQEWSIEFRGGGLKRPLRKTKKARGSGTSIFFRPDPEIFPKTEFSSETIRTRLEIASYLHRGLKVDFIDEKNKERFSYHHPQGIEEYLDRLVNDKKARSVHDTRFSLHRDDGPRVEIVLRWTEATDEHVRSYVNGIPTGSGGTHENGLRAGLSKAVRNYIETHKLLPRGVSLTSEDIREGLFGAAQRVHRRTSVSGANQRSAQQPRNALLSGLGSAPSFGTMAQPEPLFCGTNRAPNYLSSPSTRCFACGLCSGQPQNGDQWQTNVAGKTERLHG